MIRYVVLPLDNIYPGNVVAIYLSLVFASIVAFPFLGLIVVPYWMLEDSGIRLRDVDKAVERVPLERLIGYSLGIGLIGTIISMPGSIVFRMTYLLADFILIGPVCALAVVDFHCRREERLITKLSEVTDLIS